MDTTNKFAAIDSEFGGNNPESYFSNEPADRRTIGGLFNDFMVASGEIGPDDLPEADPGLAAEIGRILHDTLKANYLGEIISIADYAVWVDEHTPDGEFRFRCMLDGSNYAV